MRFRLPIPASWQDFETLCHQLWKEIWCDPNAQRNGRSGQAQRGVDVFGRPVYSFGYSGVQCKDKDGRLGSELNESEFVAECVKAQEFEPSLQTFTLASTAPRDAAIQSVARKLNTKGAFLFDVHVWSWDEIEAEVLCRPNLVNAFFASIPVDIESNAVKIAASAPREQFLAFFSRPQIAQRLGTMLRDNIIQVAYELSDNAFLHGRARHVQLSFDGAMLAVEDDGVAFNPLTDLDAKKATPFGHLGSFVIDSFVRKFRDSVDVAYTRVKKEGRERNIVTIAFGDISKYTEVPEVLDLPVDLSVAFGRRGAERLAESLPIPTGIRELVLTVTSVYNPSAFAQFIHCVRQRLPDSVLLVVSHPRDDRFGAFANMFDNGRVLFRSR